MIFHVLGLEDSTLAVVLERGRKGLALRVSGHYLLYHLVTSTSSSSCPRFPESLTTPAHFRGPESSEPSCPTLSLWLDPALPLGVRFQLRLGEPVRAAEVGASRPPTWRAVKIPAVPGQNRKSPRGGKIICQHRKPTLKLGEAIPSVHSRWGKEGEKRTRRPECFPCCTVMQRPL